MKPLSSFFERLKNLTVPDGALRDAVAAALQDVLKADVGRSHIAIRSGVAYLNTSSALKAEVQFKQRELLERVFGILGKRAISAIR